jgi:hypothetical protein
MTYQALRLRCRENDPISDVRPLRATSSRQQVQESVAEAIREYLRRRRRE